MQLNATPDDLAAVDLFLKSAPAWVDEMAEKGFTIRVAVCEVPGGWATVEVWDEAVETTVDVFTTEAGALDAAHASMRVAREQAREQADQGGPAEGSPF